tara:strand:+ start:26884 stop:27717 length:834 start_codon:yes stop_codon:yes gene_type:complete
MKKLITLSFLLFTIVVFSQRKFEGKATYMSKTTVDMSRFGKMTEQQKKQRMARFKSFLEKTYTLSFNKSESAFKENAKLDAPGTGGGRRWGASNGQGSIYKNVKDKKMIEDIEQFSKRFLIVEEMEMPQWEMTGETRKIGQYTSYKATMVKVDNTIDWGSIFSRRGKGDQKKDSTKVKEKKPEVKTQIVTAWYTPQIPVSAGPAEYWGLPGLILEINVGRTTMLCTEIVINPEKSIEIKEPTKGKEVSRDEFNKIVKTKSEELRQQFQNRRGGRRSN